MKKQVLILFSFFLSVGVFCQTPAGSFRCNMGTAHDLTETQINTFITKVDFESYRLQSERTFLKFDNGFEIMLLSADQAQGLGLISNASTYPTAFPHGFTLPVFHMTASGTVAAGYSSFNKKYSAK